MSTLTTGMRDMLECMHKFPTGVQPDDFFYPERYRKIINKLVDMELAEERFVTMQGATYFITEAGRRAIEPRGI